MPCRPSPQHCQKNAHAAAERPNRGSDTARINEIFRRFSHANPEPKGELEHVNPYTLLVAVVLSAQATDAGVNKATRDLFKVVATPQDMLALGLAQLGERIKTIGLYRNKAKNVMALSRQLIGEHGGAVPHRACGARGPARCRPQDSQRCAQHRLRRDTLAVDTHVFRVAHRLKLAKGKTPLEVGARPLARHP